MRVLEIAKKYRVPRQKVYDVIYRLQTVEGIEIKKEGNNLILTDDIVAKIEEHLGGGRREAT